MQPAQLPQTPETQVARVKDEEKGVIGIALVVWLLGGGLGLIVLIFLLSAIF